MAGFKLENEMNETQHLNNLPITLTFNSPESLNNGSLIFESIALMH
jgi:hypothetical protein